MDHSYIYKKVAKKSGKPMLYVQGRNPELVYVVNPPAISGLFSLVYSVDGLGWYADYDRLLELTPLLESLL